MDSNSSGRSLDHRASQQTLISLLELDPSPIDSPVASEKVQNRSLGEEDDGPCDTWAVASGSTPLKGSSTTFGPGLNNNAGRNTVLYLSRIQRYSSYAMSIFTSLHLANVSLIPAVQRSVPSSETYLLMTREIYQTAITEPLLVALPVMAHIGAGVALRFLRRRQNMRRYGGGTPAMYALHRSQTEKTGAAAVSLWPPLSYISMSGYAFTALYAAHVFMNRVLPLAVEGDSSNIGLAYVAHGFARHPLVACGAYLGLIVVGSGHMIWGMAKWLGLAPTTAGWRSSGVLADKMTKRARRNKWLTVHGAALATAAAWAIGGLAVVARGGLQDGWVGKGYDDLFAKVGL